MEHSLQLTASLDSPGVEKMLSTLRTIPGIRVAEVSSGSSEVHVQYDESLTSPQEISATVARSGFPLRHTAARAGGCCGGCGGH